MAANGIGGRPMMSRSEIEEYAVATVFALLFVAGLVAIVVLLAEFVG